MVCGRIIPCSRAYEVVGLGHVSRDLSGVGSHLESLQFRIAEGLTFLHCGNQLVRALSQGGQGGETAVELSATQAIEVLRCGADLLLQGTSGS
jgi:hypothetical protein